MSSAAKVDAFGDPLPRGAVARLGTQRLQQAAVRSLCFSAKGDLLASGGAGPVHVWDPETGRRLHSLPIPSGTGFAVAFGNKSELFAVARGSTVASWPRPDTPLRWRTLGLTAGTLGFHEGKLVAADRGLILRARNEHAWTHQEIEGHELLDLEDPAAFGGGRLVIATAKGDARIFHVPSGSLRNRVQLGAAATAVALSASGETLAAGFRDGRIGLFDVPSRRQLAEWPAHPADVSALAFSPDGAVVASGSGARIRLWNAATGGERLSLSTFDETPARVSFRPDSPTIVTRSGLLLQEWDVETGAELSAIPARGVWDDGSRIPESRFVAFEAEPASWTVWDTAVGRETYRVAVEGVAGVSAAGDLVMIASGVEREMRLLELPKGAVRWSRDFPADFRETPTLARFVPGNAWALVGRTYDRVWLVDTRNGHTDRVLVGPIAVSRDGAWIASTSGNGDDIPRRVEIFEPRPRGRGWQPRAPLTPSGAVRAIALAPFRPLIAVASGTDAIEVWDLSNPATSRPAVTLRGTEAHDLAFSPDGRRLASISWTTADVLIWDVPA